MNLSELFSWGAVTPKDTELPEIFPMPIPRHEFITTDVVTIYSKILTDVLERVHGLSADQTALLWDNCVKSNSSDGLITLLARAMAGKDELYVVFDKVVNVIRLATSQEKAEIQADYLKAATSNVGVYISFKNYRRSDMVKLYSALEYCTIAALNKTLNISSAPQFKFSDLRGSVSITDSSKVVEQAESIAAALMSGRPIMLDAKDSVETGTPDLTATEKSIQFIGDKLAFYLGMPSSYITGEQTGGIGSTGENDARAVERGLKAYYFSILKPALEAIFGVTGLSYKSQDFRNISGALEILKTFQLVGEEFVSTETKQRIVNQAFDLPEDTEGEVIEVAAALGGADIQKQALNGAQLASMVEVVTAVAAGTLPRESGVQMIMLAFQVDQPLAEKLLGSAGKGFKAATPAPSFPRAAE